MLIKDKGSSLHYAACFGRPGIAKVLLNHGANPDLRDEDGTPLDKSRERIKERHREISSILQSPGELMTASSEINETENTEPRGEPQIAPVYLKCLLPDFCQTFQNTMLQSVKKTCLGLIKKMVQRPSQPDLLRVLATDPEQDMGKLMLEVVSSVLHNEEDEDGHIIILTIIEELMSKTSYVFLDHFARVGVFQNSYITLDITSFGTTEEEAN